jgi:hypothetical protein
MRDLNSIYFPASNLGYVVDDGGEIIRTTDAGHSWTFDSSGTWNDLMSVFFTDSTTGYAVGDEGTILKKGNGGVTFIKEHQPSETTFTICPNPANDKITVETSSTPAVSQLSIINLNGQEVLASQISEPKTQIDISNLPRGVYFVRLTNDRTVEVRKFVKE